MKKTSKFAVFFLSVLFILSACQASEPEIVPEYNTDVSAADLDGLNFVWGHAYTGTVYGYIDGTAHSDMALNREKEVEDTLNCTIEVEYNADINTAINTAVMSGQPRYDIAIGGSYGLVDPMRAGYLSGISSLIDVHNTDKWGTPGMLQSMLWKDDLYGVVPYAWPELVYNSTDYPIVVNEDLIAKYGHTDPREYVENGTWTWDKFEEVLRAYTTEEADRTIYAMAIHPPYYFISMFLSNGVTMSMYDENGVSCGLYSERGIEALERAVKILRETCKDCFYPADAHGGPGVDWFVNGDIFMLTLRGYELLKDENCVMYRANNVGYIPYPQGPNAVKNYYYSDHSSLEYTTVIPLNVKELEATAIVLSEMYEPFDAYKTKAELQDYMGKQIFFDERDAGIMFNMISHAEYGFFKEGGRSVIDTLKDSTESVQVILESLESKYQDILENYMIPHYEGRIAVYGE